MAWSVQIPNPLTVGGNGDIGEIDILNPDGSTGVRIDAGNGPEIVIIDSNGNTLTIFVSGSPVINYNYGGGRNGFGTLFLGEYGVGLAQNYFRLGFGTTIGDFVNFILQEAVSGVGQILVTHPLIASDPALAGNPGDNETWHDATLQNGWTNLGSGYSNCQYRKLPYGYVGLRGVPTAGTKTNGTTIFTLPSAYRPPATKQLLVPNGAQGGVRIEVQTDGQVKIYDQGANNSIVLDDHSFELGII